jgi:hypothetical protein
MHDLHLPSSLQQLGCWGAAALHTLVPEAPRLRTGVSPKIGVPLLFTVLGGWMTPRCDRDRPNQEGLGLFRLVAASCDRDGWWLVSVPSESPKAVDAVDA